MLEPTVAAKMLAGDRRIVIVGAGGWLGRATLESLATALGDTIDDRVVCVGSSRRSLRLRDGREIAQIALNELQALDRRPSWVLHFAFLTKDRAEQMSEAEYRAANGRIGEAVLAALDAIGAEAIFVASSGAAYRAGDPAASAAMSLYGELKQEDELRFERWAQASGRRAVITRIFNVTGPYINKHQAYALASFILDGLAGRRIEVRAPRRVARAYVAISEVMSLAFAELGAVTSGISRFDTGGQPLELGEVAAIVAAQFPQVEVLRAPIVDEHDDIYHGDVVAYTRLLDHHGIAAMPLETQVAKTIDYLRADQ